MKRVLIVFALAAMTMSMVFQFAGWYADNAALPRYCNDPVGAVERVAEILDDNVRAYDRARRPYLVAAKLIFLVPQADGEARKAYLRRLQSTIARTCGDGPAGRAIAQG